MGDAIEGFYSTWNNARGTFGEGTPCTGKDFDDSSTALRGLDSYMEAAAPGDRWRGTAATAYGTANAEHRQIITTLAHLDERVGAEITNSAEVVTAGRRDLDTVRQWVKAAETSVPPGGSGDRMKLVIARRGLAQLREVIQKTNSRANAIGGRVQALNGEYEKLGTQRFAPGEGEGPLPLTDEEEKEQAQEETARKAKDDVDKTLHQGDQAAAGRVAQVLGTIEPYRESTPEQASYLNEMQAQQQGTSVADLKSAADRLGDEGHVCRPAPNSTAR